MRGRLEKYVISKARKYYISSRLVTLLRPPILYNSNIFLDKIARVGEFRGRAMYPLTKSHFNGLNKLRHNRTLTIKANLILFKPQAPNYNKKKRISTLQS